MNAAIRDGLLVVGCLLAGLGEAGSASRLSIRVSPTMTLAPAFVVVRAQVEADQDNRSLDVIAESDDFYASSQVPLNGAQSPRTSEIRFAGLPAGAYQITAILTGSQGRVAAATQTLVVAGMGERR